VSGLLKILGIGRLSGFRWSHSISARVAAARKHSFFSAVNRPYSLFQ
jgi:hypothetical protein